MLGFEALTSRRLLAADTFASPAEGESSAALVEYRLETVHPVTGEALSEVTVGSPFLVRAIADDLRAFGDDGVFSAYVDLNFSSELASPSGPIAFDDLFPYVRTGERTEVNRFTATGATRGLGSIPGGAPQTVFEIMMVAQQQGQFTINAGPAEGPLAETLLYGIDTIIPKEAIRYGTSSLLITDAGSEGPPPQGISDLYRVEEDASLTISIDAGVLVNDEAGRGSEMASLTAILDSAPQYGSLELDSNGSFNYVPDANFNGTDSFLYRAYDGARLSEPTKVIIEVEAVDDAPIATADRYVVLPGATVRVSAGRGVLANDQDLDNQPLRSRLLSPPSEGQLTLNADGSFQYSAPDSLTEDQQFTYEVSDGQLTGSATVQLSVRSDNEEEDWETLGAVINVRLQAVDGTGAVVSEVPAGGQFFVEAYARDLRANAKGVFSAYFDLTYESQLAQAEAPLTYGNIFKYGQSGSLEHNEIDELGSFSSSFTYLDGGEYLVARVPFVARAPGVLTIDSNTADLIPTHESLLYGVNDFVPPEKVRFGSTSITIASGAIASDDSFQLTEDQESTLDVLANDAFNGTTLRVASLRPSSIGAQLTIADDGSTVSYTPPENYFGVDTFTYTVIDESGNQGTGTVTIEVENVNDNPTAVDDRHMVSAADVAEGENVSLIRLNVLSNDVAEPDIGETLIITDVRDPLGLATISPDRKSLLLPANDRDTRTLEYTISDGNGGVAAALVTLETEDLPTNPYQNPKDPFDINGDEIVSPIDVLYLVNKVNQQDGSLLQTVDMRRGDGTRIFLDPSGDLHTTALDVLQVVNRLNNQTRGQGGEGEQPGAIPPFASTRMDLSHTPALLDLPRPLRDTELNDQVESEDSASTVQESPNIGIGFVKSENSDDTDSAEVEIHMAVDAALELEAAVDYVFELVGLS